ncbi:MAG: hypothetical protein HDR21_12550 [Lachnospiraceae bacterium]|nr:hypothetical protein [Lachnospiraceae bacterium]
MIMHFRHAWKHIIYHKYNSIILVIALVLGFLFPLLAVNDINDVIRDGEVSRYPDASRISVFEYLMNYKDEEEIEAAIDRCLGEGLFERAGYSFSRSEIVYVGDQSYTCGISGISREYLSLAGWELMGGAFFSDSDYAADGEKVCLFNYGAGFGERNIRVGDTIEILGEAFPVKGIVRVPRVYGSILIPYTASAVSADSDFGSWVQYQVLTYGEGNVRPMAVARKLFELSDTDGGVLSAQTGEEQEELYYASIWKINKYRILRAVVVIVFAGLSMLLLFIGMILRERYDMAVRIALGASRTVLWLESVVRNLLLVLIAFFIALVLYPCLSVRVAGAGSHLLLRTIVQVGIGGAVFVILVDSAVLLIGFRKQNVALLLKG